MCVTLQLVISRLKRLDDLATEHPILTQVQIVFIEKSLHITGPAWVKPVFFEVNCML